MVAKRNSLKKLLAEAAPLEEMMKKSPPLPITRMHLSDRFSKVSCQAHLCVCVCETMEMRFLANVFPRLTAPGKLWYFI